MVHAKTHVSKGQDLLPFQYDKMYIVHLGTTKLVTSHKSSLSIAQGTVEVYRYQIQLFDGYRTFETMN